MSTPDLEPRTRAPSPPPASPPTRRVVRLVELLALHPDRAFTQTELVGQLGLSKATGHAVLHELVAAGWVERDPDRRYRIGRGIPGAGLVTPDQRAADEVLVQGRGHIEALRSTMGAPCLVSARRGNAVIVLARFGQGDRPEMATRVGQRFPFAPPFGVNFVAWASDAVVDRWLGGDRITEADRAQIRRALALTRRLGFSVERLSEPMLRVRRLVAEAADDHLSSSLQDALEDVVVHFGAQALLSDELSPDVPVDVNRIAAPVRDGRGETVLSLSVQLARSSMTGGEVLDVAGPLLEAAGQLSRLAAATSG
jgi:DNA-binding IclR family transcriptional regulator